MLILISMEISGDKEKLEEEKGMIKRMLEVMLDFESGKNVDQKVVSVEFEEEKEVEGKKEEGENGSKEVEKV